MAYNAAMMPSHMVTCLKLYFSPNVKLHDAMPIFIEVVNSFLACLLLRYWRDATAYEMPASLHDNATMMMSRGDFILRLANFREGGVITYAHDAAKTIRRCEPESLSRLSTLC